MVPFSRNRIKKMAYPGNTQVGSWALRPWGMRPGYREAQGIQVTEFSMLPSPERT